MFVRVKKIGAYEYLYLVENAREGGRHVQRVIKALGRRDEVEASGLLDGLIASAARHSRRSIVLSSFYRGELPELHRMISADTIAALEAEKIQYILGVRERTSREVRTEVIEDDGLAVPLLIPRQKGETELAIRETKIAGRRYVICRNEEEAKKDAAARTHLVAGLERKLAQGDKALVANKGFRRFLKTPEGDGFVIDRAKIEADARFDGLFVLRTNTKITALQVVLRYRNLLAVEDAFKTAKALLATRPIFHKTDAGIRGHVFCTFLALVLRKELIDRLAARRSRLEWQRIIDDLADLSEIDVQQDGRRARLRTAPGPTIDPICRAVGITLPPVFQEMPPAAP